MNRETRTVKWKGVLIFSLIFLFSGLVSWCLGGPPNNVLLFYIFPRCALPIPVMYFLWFVSFAYLGFVFGGIFTSCEKFRKREAHKILFFIFLSHIIVLSTYPIFFKALSPFVNFIVLLISIILALFAFLLSIKQYTIWTYCILLHIIWLVYNGYVSMAFAFIN